MSQRVAHFRQKAGYVSTVGAAIFLTGAFLLASGIFTRADSQTNEKKKGGDTVLLMQTDSTYRMPTVRKDTVKTMDTVPQIVKPDVRTLEHYNPWPGVLNDSTFTKMDKLSIQAYRSSWMSMEGDYPPFGIPKKVIDSYPPGEKKELLRRWEIAKNELRVAFLSDKGATPANAFKIHTPEEIQKMLETWQGIKELRNQKITRPPVQ